MRIDAKDIILKQRIYIWGTGAIAKKYEKFILKTLKIEAFCDSCHDKWTDNYMNGIPCVDSTNIDLDVSVIVSVEYDGRAYKEITDILNNKGIDYCHVEEVASIVRPEIEKREIKKYDDALDLKENTDSNILRRYLNIHIPYNMCNLSCEYCYVGRSGGFKNRKVYYPAAEYLKRAFSRKRWGGICFINFCAEGETLLDYRIIDIVKALIEEGHYIQIVTNGTVTNAFIEMQMKKVDFSHILFKFSLHYQQLKTRNLLDAYFDNINYVKKMGASITLELVPDDSLVEDIEDIKTICIEKVGALPQLTVARDVNVSNLPILTQMTEIDFAKTWKVFDSEMFNIKMDNIGIKRCENCWAGELSFWIDMETGEMFKCCKFGFLGNVYDDICNAMSYEKVGNSCEVPYCYNGHIYFPFGIVDEVETCSYADIRDRKMTDGNYWISDKMRNIISQNLKANKSYFEKQ